MSFKIVQQHLEQFTLELENRNENNDWTALLPFDVNVQLINVMATKIPDEDTT